MEFFDKVQNSKRLSKWDIRPSDFALFICFLLSGAYILSGVLVGAYSYFSGDARDFESMPLIIASGIGLQSSSLIAWLLFKRFVPYENANQPEAFTKSVGIGVIGFVCVYLLLIPIMFIWKTTLDSLSFGYEFQLPVLLVQNGGTPMEMSLLAFLVVILAPICEEIVYRGFIFRYLNERVSFGLAIALSSAVFASLHFNLYSFLPLFTLGIALCIVYKLSGNIVSSIIIHLLFNLVNLVMIYFTDPIQL